MAGIPTRGHSKQCGEARYRTFLSPLPWITSTECTLSMSCTCSYKNGLTVGTTHIGTGNSLSQRRRKEKSEWAVLALELFVYFGPEGDGEGRALEKTDQLEVLREYETEHISGASQNPWTLLAQRPAKGDGHLFVTFRSDSL
ncbi:hypothetical protein RRG08_027789 [Elysia crispata]|uniref:Uncharacterized protein n=1 Tax=Elysia crispata TaxID=231223 RepID=A0AAE1DCQ5_9GAST|nr:hypothetical protein RRG08_027789 [Elysia crispata]